ncbi:MAG: hypothetical protein ACR2O4_04095 [Hyphomicrobiaceae bacterium]
MRVTPVPGPILNWHQRSQLSAGGSEAVETVLDHRFHLVADDLMQRRTPPLVTLGQYPASNWSNNKTQQHQEFRKEIDYDSAALTS